MRLISITCPNCGAKLQATPNAKMLTCDYCNCDVMVDDEVKKFRLQDAEQAGYEFEKGRQRAIREEELAKHLAQLESEQAKKAATEAVCPFCERLLIVDKRYADNTCCYCEKIIDTVAAINLRKGSYLSARRKYDQAIDCYNKVLLRYPGNILAQKGIESVSVKIKNHVFIRAEQPNLFEKNDELEFKRHELLYIKPNRKTIVYSYDKMTNLDINFFGVLTFSYPDNENDIVLSTNVDSEIILDFILNAQNGKYPPYDFKYKRKWPTST